MSIAFPSEGWKLIKGIYFGINSFVIETRAKELLIPGKVRQLKAVQTVASSLVNQNIIH